MNPTVVATVDAGRSDVVIWWTNIRAEKTSSLARNCGAWELKKDDLESIKALTADKICLATPTGQKFLDANAKKSLTYLDANATLAGVIAERQRLEMVLETAKTRTNLKPLIWPTQPTPLNPTKIKDPNAPKAVQRTLAIAKWLVLLSEYWESIEEIRLSRPALRKLGDGPLRQLPLVTEGRSVKTSKNSGPRKSPRKKTEATPSLFGDTEDE